MKRWNTRAGEGISGPGKNKLFQNTVKTPFLAQWVEFGPFRCVY